MSSKSYKHETFKNAPIVEALLDIRVKKIEDERDQLFDKFTAAVSPHFPEKHPRKSVSGNIEIGTDSSLKSIDSHLVSNGFAFISSDKTRVIQARQDGFSYSKLKPYDDWGKLRDEAKKYWLEYCKLVGASRVERIALRYINRIDIPVPFADFKEYFLTWVDVPPNIPQGVSELFFRVSLPDPETKGKIMASVTGTFQGETDGKLHCILDIDAFEGISIDAKDEIIWDDFEKIRNYKNEIFFNSITQKAREMFR